MPSKWPAAISCSTDSSSTTSASLPASAAGAPGWLSPLALSAAGQNASVPQELRIEFRIGIHVGDIIIDDNDTIRGCLDVERAITKNEQSLLNPIGINCIRPFGVRGIRVWGARTLASDTELAGSGDATGIGGVWPGATHGGAGLGRAARQRCRGRGAPGRTCRRPGEMKKAGKSFADKRTTEEDAQKEYRAIAERRVRLRERIDALDVAGHWHAVARGSLRLAFVAALQYGESGGSTAMSSAPGTVTSVREKSPLISASVGSVLR